MRAIREEEIKGLRYGNLVVLGFSETKNNSNTHHKFLLCQCDCGKVKNIDMSHIRTGRTKSCGCGIGKSSKERNTSHGGTKTRLYRIWANMKTRCSNEKVSYYKYYGGRGIKVSNEWMKFEPFREWSLEHGYRDDLTIDRIDVNGNYSPSNCRWITLAEQQRNKRNVKRKED